MKPFFYLFSLLVATGLAEEKMPLSKEYWKSPQFLKEFNGSYRVNANIEPVLSGEERAELIAIQKLMAEGKREDAIKKLLESKNAKDSASIQFNLGNIYSEEGKLKEAVEVYKKAIELLPSFRRAHQNLAYAYVKSDDYESAFPHLLKVVKLGGQDGSVMGLIGFCYARKDKHQPALQAFSRALLVQPDVTDWHIATARSLKSLGRYQEALRKYREMAKLSPENESIQLAMVDIHLILDETDKAIVLMEILRRKEKLSAENKLTLGMLLIGQGQAFVGAKRLKEVVGDKKLAKSGPALNAIRYCLNTGNVSLAKELIGLLDPTVVKQENQVVYDRLRARILLTEETSTKQALEILRELVKKDPSDAQSLVILGKYHASVGKHQEAMVYFEQAAIGEELISRAAMEGIATSAVALGLYDKAVVTLKKILEGGDDSRISDYLKAVERVKAASEMKK